jgi:hypothetical protein
VGYGNFICAVHTTHIGKAYWYGRRKVIQVEEGTLFDAQPALKPITDDLLRIYDHCGGYRRVTEIQAGKINRIRAVPFSSGSVSRPEEG